MLKHTQTHTRARMHSHTWGRTAHTRTCMHSRTRMHSLTPGAAQRTRAHACTRAHTHALTHTWGCTAHTRTCMHSRTHACTHSRLGLHSAHAHMHALAHIRMHSLTPGAAQRTRTHACTRAHTHALTHTWGCTAQLGIRYSVTRVTPEPGFRQLDDYDFQQKVRADGRGWTWVDRGWTQKRLKLPDGLCSAPFDGIRTSGTL